VIVSNLNRELPFVGVYTEFSLSKLTTALASLRALLWLTD